MRKGALSVGECASDVGTLAHGRETGWNLSESDQRFNRKPCLTPLAGRVHFD